MVIINLYFKIKYLIINNLHQNKPALTGLFIEEFILILM